jgi:predicted short-subunit dehydrogenase-like oxidoreductase (DUF2520 family)
MPQNNTIRIGFIGAGKAGCSIGQYIADKISDENKNKNENADANAGTDANMNANKNMDANTNASMGENTNVVVDEEPVLAQKFKLAGYYSRSLSSAKDAAAWTNSKAFESSQALIEASDVVFITVPDDMIAKVWADLTQGFPTLPDPQPLQRDPRPAQPQLAGKTLCHCSGSLTSALFQDAQKYGAYACSLHPLFAISDRQTAWKQLSESCFTYEGSEAAYDRLAPLLQFMGNKIGRIDADKKVLYHAACVFFSNLAVGLAGCGEALLKSCGLDKDFAETAWHALFLGNSENIVKKGTTNALTGPAERGDTETIQKHIAALKANTAQYATNTLAIYKELTEVLLEIAAEKHKK